MIELIGAIVTIVAVTGVILNNRKCQWCFVLWMVSNTLSAFIQYSVGPWPLVVRDLIFLILAAEGYFLWKAKCNNG